MKNFLLLSMATFFITLGAKASIVETKFKVTSRYYDEEGNTKKLVNTRAFIRYSPEASVLSDEARDNCLVQSGKADIAGVFLEAEKANCISSKTFVVTSEDIVIEMFYRPTMYSFFKDRISDVSEIINQNGKVSGVTERDAGVLGSVRSMLRNSVANAVEAQTISLVGRTVFTLKGKSKAKFIIELEPVETKVLNH
jgi:hypothetical protein